jgi:glycosyltransferase involved in cell wall biosynthesis
MNNIKVSILTTVYNRDKYIAACIESVLASTYQNWELIIVDDVSSDTSVAIARAYEQKDARIKVYVNDKNLGDYPNRNKAASYAKGKYIKYLDADDIIYPHGLEIMVNTMEQFPEAGLGISQKVVEDVKPYPFIMQPKETVLPVHVILATQKCGINLPWLTLWLKWSMVLFFGASMTINKLSWNNRIIIL